MSYIEWVQAISGGLIVLAGGWLVFFYAPWVGERMAEKTLAWVASRKGTK